MRTIKFRGMVHGDWWYVTPEDDEWEQFWAIVDKNTVGEYVGHIDKNGREVYEGDIVKAWLNDDGQHDEEVVEEVSISENGFLAPFYMRVFFEEEWWKDRLDDGFEIIGNIYEHPLLLKDN